MGLVEPLPLNAESQALRSSAQNSLRPEAKETTTLLPGQSLDAACAQPKPPRATRFPPPAPSQAVTRLFPGRKSRGSDLANLKASPIEIRPMPRHNSMAAACNSRTTRDALEQMIKCQLFRLPGFKEVLRRPCLHRIRR